MSQEPVGGGGEHKVTRRAVAKGAAWAVPAVAVASMAPHVAASPVPCPEKAGNYYAVLYSPPGSGKVLQDRAPGTDGLGSITIDGCTSTAPGCTASPGYTRVLADDIGLIRTGVNISHDTSQQNTGAVTFALRPDSCCVITKVKAHLHRYGASTSPDCPNPYCQEAGASTTFTIVADGGGLGTKSVTVKPADGNVCTNPSAGVHWGSPNWNRGCTGTNNQRGAFDNGQPYGFLLVEVSCTGRTS